MVGRFKNIISVVKLLRDLIKGFRSRVAGHDDIIQAGLPGSVILKHNAGRILSVGVFLPHGRAA